MTFHLITISSVYGGGRLTILGNGFSQESIQSRSQNRWSSMCHHHQWSRRHPVYHSISIDQFLILSSLKLFHLASILHWCSISTQHHWSKTFFLETQVFESVEYRVRSCQCRPHQSVVGWLRISQLDIIQSLLMSISLEISMPMSLINKHFRSIQLHPTKEVWRVVYLSSSLALVLLVWMSLFLFAIDLVHRSKSNRIRKLICVTPSISPHISNNLTANITSISPLRGGTGGKHHCDDHRSWFHVRSSFLSAWWWSHAILCLSLLSS